LLRRLRCASTVVKVLETPLTSIDLDPGQCMAFFSLFLFCPCFVPVVEYGLLQYGIAPLFRSKVLVRDSTVVRTALSHAVKTGQVETGSGFVLCVMA